MGRKGKGGAAGKPTPAPTQRTYKKEKEEAEKIYEGGELPTFLWIPAEVGPLSNDLQEPLNTWISRLTDQVDEPFKKHIQRQLQGTVEQIPALNNQQQLAALLKYYTDHPNVKDTAEKWEEVVGDRISGTSFHVCSNKGRRLFGNEDVIYRADPTLLQYLPRGCVMIEGPGGELALVTFATPKIFGRKAGDDDDSDIVSRTIQRGDFSSFVVSEKANGECCHVSLCPFDDSLWIIGSKNRKIVVSSREDIAKYESQECYTFAVEMANTFFTKLQEMGAEKVKELKELFRITRWTFIFEFESDLHQHIVSLNKGSTLVLIGCSGIHVSPGRVTHPMLGYAVASYFGFNSVMRNQSVHAKEEEAGVCNEIVQEWNTEGKVLVLLDAESNVVDLVKVKSWWYVLLRCIREKIRGSFTKRNDLRTVCVGINQRVDQLKKAMKMTDDYARCFGTLGVEFAAWLVTNRVMTKEEIIDNYPTCWKDFLVSRKLPLDRTLLTTELEARENVDYSKSSVPLLVLMQGIPGIGKSYLGSKLSERLNAAGIKCVHVAQDDFVPKFGLKNSGKACQDFVRSSLIDPENRIVILARNNANLQQYQDYLAMDGEGLCRAVFICPRELSSRVQEAAFLCVAGVLHRKVAKEDHPTNDMEDCNLASLPLKFFGSLKVHPSAFLVSVFSDEPITIPNQAMFERLLSRFLSKGFKSPDVSPDDLRVLGLDTKENLAQYQRYRRDISSSVGDCFEFLTRILPKNTPSTGSYYAVSLNSDSSLALMEFAKGLFEEGDLPKSWTLHANHVTLMHSNSFFASRESIEMWEGLSKLLGTPVEIRPLSILVNDRLATLKVSCVTDEGNNIDNFVVTGMPHVTIATAPKVSAFESSSALKGGVGLTQTETPLLTGFIELIELTTTKTDD